MLQCRVCHSPHSVKSFTALNTHGRHLINKQAFYVYHCPDCQTYFLGPVEKKSDYYFTSYINDYYPSPGFANRIISLLDNIRINLIIRQFPEHHKISLLDIGCGQGEFLKSLPDHIFIKTGLEINPTAVKLASAKGLKIVAGDINSLKLDNQKFDCITLWHVLEHLPHPSDTIKKLYRILNPQGVLLLATPNSDSVGFKYGQKYYFHLDAPRHLFIPNHTNLSLMLTRAKFSKFTFINPFYDYPLDLFWSLRRSVLKYLIYPLYPIFKILSSETVYTLAVK